jgi:hypothetical protein
MGKEHETYIKDGGEYSVETDFRSEERDLHVLRTRKVDPEVAVSTTGGYKSLERGKMQGVDDMYNKEPKFDKAYSTVDHIGFGPKGLESQKVVRKMEKNRR